MSFQAYLDNIEAKTGRTAQDIAALVRAQGLAKPAEVVAWLKAEFGLGHGHAMAIVSVLRHDDQPARTAEERIAAHFAGAKAKWRGGYDRLLACAGTDVSVSPAASYLSLLRGERKFAIVQVVGERMDLGLKLKGTPAAGRLEDAGRWNAMVTHRVRITDDAELDEEVLEWLTQARDKA